MATTSPRQTTPTRTTVADVVLDSRGKWAMHMCGALTNVPYDVLRAAGVRVVMTHWHAVECDDDDEEEEETDDHHHNHINGELGRTSLLAAMARVHGCVWWPVDHEPLVGEWAVARVRALGRSPASSRSSRKQQQQRR